jgi:integrase
MSNRSKGVRLWLRKGKGTIQSIWIIRDGPKQVRTGCGLYDREEAERKLSSYIDAKYRPERQRNRDPSQILIADVLNIYAEDIRPTIRRPVELGQRIFALLSFFGIRTLAEINGPTCRNYVESRGSVSMARRELEDLRAAINHHRREGLCSEIIEVTLPPKSIPRERWLTRVEAAKMIREAWRFQEVQEGRPTGRHSRRHIARFMLVALYTGTRSGAICTAAVGQAVGRGYVDLKEGVFYRRDPGKRETKKRQPTIRVPERLLAHMRRWERLGISKSSVIEFTGRPVKSVRKAFARVALAAGLEDVTPHILRHTAVTWAMQAGADPYAAADFFGMSLEILQRVYGHHHPDQHKAVGEALTRRTGSAQVGRNRTR